jgi:hypothetical protein
LPLMRLAAAGAFLSIPEPQYWLSEGWLRQPERLSIAAI